MSESGANANANAATPAPAASTILLTGGTGTLGSHVLPLLRAAGTERLRLLSRQPRQSGDGVQYVVGDLLKNEGVQSAVDGADVIVHLAGANKGDDVSTANLVKAAARADVRHIVYISVTAADKMPIGYFRAKAAAERAVEQSGVPWSTLRAAQFHDLVLWMMQKAAKLPVLPAPGAMRLQPVDSREVAARLVELALGAPAGLVPDLVGPRVYTFPELARSYLRAAGKRRPLLPVPIPGGVGRAYKAGQNLSLDGAQVGKRSWEDFLAERFGRES